MKTLLLKSLLKAIQEYQGVIAVYSYEMNKEIVIPVVVIEAYSEEFIQRMKTLSIESIIILTKNDITHGHDVYGISLLHIFLNSTVEFGTNILESIELTKEHMKVNLEGSIRHLLIDLRECLIQNKSLGDMMPRIEVQCDRIWLACGFLLDCDLDMVNTIIDTIESQRQIDHHALYNTMHHGSGTTDLFAIHTALTQLVDKIDSL